MTLQPNAIRSPGRNIHSRNAGDRMRVVLVASACVAGLAAGISCKPGSGAPPTPATTATSSVSFRMSASGAPKCTSNLRWEWMPVSLVTGTTGSTAGFTIPASGFTAYDVPSSTITLGNGERMSICDMNADGLQALAPGQWKLALVEAVAGRLAECAVTLRAGANWAGFRQGAITCKETPAGSLGFQYP